MIWNTVIVFALKLCQIVYSATLVTSFKRLMMPASKFDELQSFPAMVTASCISICHQNNDCTAISALESQCTLYKKANISTTDTPGNIMVYLLRNADSGG